ncbi:hypothetical protein BOX15_Mlig025131g2, partial [Macrostomum lignano]
ESKLPEQQQQQSQEQQQANQLRKSLWSSLRRLRNQAEQVLLLGNNEAINSCLTRLNFEADRLESIANNGSVSELSNDTDLEKKPIVKVDFTVAKASATSISADSIVTENIGATNSCINENKANVTELDSDVVKTSSDADAVDNPEDYIRHNAANTSKSEEDSNDDSKSNSSKEETIFPQFVELMPSINVESTEKPIDWSSVSYVTSSQHGLALLCSDGRSFIWKLSRAKNSFERVFVDLELLAFLTPLAWQPPIFLVRKLQDQFEQLRILRLADESKVEVTSIEFPKNVGRPMAADSTNILLDKVGKSNCRRDLRALILTDSGQFLSLSIVASNSGVENCRISTNLVPCKIVTDAAALSSIKLRCLPSINLAIIVDFAVGVGCIVDAITGIEQRRFVVDFPFVDAVSLPKLVASPGSGLFAVADANGCVSLRDAQLDDCPTIGRFRPITFREILTGLSNSGDSILFIDAKDASNGSLILRSYKQIESVDPNSEAAALCRSGDKFCLVMGTLSLQYGGDGSQAIELAASFWLPATTSWLSVLRVDEDGQPTEMAALTSAGDLMLSSGVNGVVRVATGPSVRLVRAAMFKTSCRCIVGMVTVSTKEPEVLRLFDSTRGFASSKMLGGEIVALSISSELNRVFVALARSASLAPGVSVAYIRVVALRVRATAGGICLANDLPPDVLFSTEKNKLPVDMCCLPNGGLILLAYIDAVDVHDCFDGRYLRSIDLSSTPFLPWPPQQQVLSPLGEASSCAILVSGDQIKFFANLDSEIKDEDDEDDVIVCNRDVYLTPMSEKPTGHLPDSSTVV